MPEPGTEAAGGAAPGQAPAPKTGFFARWKDQLPGVAASLTTAAILFVASLAFHPVRAFLFAKPAIDYPISCTADPVPGPNGSLEVEFFVVNRSDEALTGAELQQRLNRSLEGSGLSGDARIFLAADPGLVLGAMSSDDAFNGDKGRLGFAALRGGVGVTIERIAPHSILRGRIALPERRPDVEILRASRGELVPFTLGPLLENCYSVR